MPFCLEIRKDLAHREEESLRKIASMLEPLLGDPLDDCKPFEVVVLPLLFYLLTLVAKYII